MARPCIGTLSMYRPVDRNVKVSLKLFTKGLSIVNIPYQTLRFALDSIITESPGRNKIVPLLICIVTSNDTNN